MTLVGAEKTTERPDRGSSKAFRQKDGRKGGSREMPGREYISFCPGNAFAASLGKKQNKKTCLIFWDARLLAMGNYLNLVKKTKKTVCPLSPTKAFNRYLNTTKHLALF